MNVLELMTQQQREDYATLETTEAKRLFFQKFYKNNFLAFVWLLGYRDLGKFHGEQIKKLAEFQFVEGEKPIRRYGYGQEDFSKQV